MALAVYPRMKALFQAHDAKEYAIFRCQTCHGDDMERAGFRMPNSLYALPESDPVKAALEYDPATAKFMVDQVVPAMKELLGKNDPAVEARSGCLSCHQTER